MRFSPADSGSSPRGRGTPAAARPRSCRQRFIPARAGNTPTAPGVRNRLPVHPRAGGEHYRAPYAVGWYAGSSPRGRGTRGDGGRNPEPHRFIPARAGNTARPPAWLGSPAVHPRAGGEHGGERGPRPGPGRFIPARAGNTNLPGQVVIPPPVHPRAGGEHSTSICPVVSQIGSSPRGRGTQRVRAVEPEHLRFIPARAGNTFRPHPPRTGEPVHPRAGGEHGNTPSRSSRSVGSSPRGRGTPLVFEAPQRLVRFIPARAGNTQRAASPCSASPVHPRAGGEHAPVVKGIFTSSGSSPRGRGTPGARRRGGAPGRFIPARAGNTRWSRSGGTAGSVHPRAGGEHTTAATWSCAAAGSSPRGRGTLRQPAASVPEHRFIPARAGNTGAVSVSPQCQSVHPRAGGEHDHTVTEDGSSNGSSPRGRGTRACATSGRTSSPVHPRAGGEHCGARPCQSASGGSSPRGRGTRGHPPPPRS